MQFFPILVSQNLFIVISCSFHYYYVLPLNEGLFTTIIVLPFVSYGVASHNFLFILLLIICLLLASVQSYIILKCSDCVSSKELIYSIYQKLNILHRISLLQEDIRIFLIFLNFQPVS